MLKNDNATFQSFDNKIVFQVTDWNILNEISADNFFICESVALFRFNSYSWSEDFNIWLTDQNWMQFSIIDRRLSNEPRLSQVTW